MNIRRFPVGIRDPVSRCSGESIAMTAARGWLAPSMVTQPRNDEPVLGTPLMPLVAQAASQ
jgi:hypothetical protein